MLQSHKHRMPQVPLKHDWREGLGSAEILLQADFFLAFHIYWLRRGSLAPSRLTAMAARLGFVLTSPPAACLPAELLLKRHGHGSCAEKSATPWVCVSDPTFLHLNSTCVFCLLIQKRAKHRTPLWGIRRREMLHPCWQHRFIECPAQTLAGLKISSPSICCAVNSRTCSSCGNSESAFLHSQSSVVLHFGPDSFRPQGVGLLSTTRVFETRQQKWAKTCINLTPFAKVERKRAECSARKNASSHEAAPGRTVSDP